MDGLQKRRVQIYNNGKWGLVCSDGWDSYDATVVCQEEKLGTNGNATQMSYNKTEIVLISGFNCVGDESQLSFCPHSGIGVVDNCTLVAGVECFSKAEIKFSTLCIIKQITCNTKYLVM